MLTDVSCFSFSTGSINNPVFIDSGYEGSRDTETPVTAKYTCSF